METIIDAAIELKHDSLLKQILRNNRVIAVVGLSPKEDRPSHRIAVYLLEQGYEVISVNPMHTEILAQPSYPSLLEIPGEIDLVVVFRRSEFVPDIVKQSIEKKARVLWLQDGVIHQEAAERALSAGLQVVMDRCILRDHKRLIHGVSLGRILADFRIQQGLSLEDVAKSIDMTPEKLEIFENDPDGGISTDLIKRIASVIEGS
jgi:predicted CoA-binding protein